MKKKIMLIVLCFAIAKCGFAQSFSINTDGSTADSSAIFDVKDTSKGILITRMTMAQRNAIVSPANSLLIFQKDNDHGYYYYDSTSATWLKLAGQEPGYGTCNSITPKPSYTVQNGLIANGVSSNTNALLGQVQIPFKILVSQLSFQPSFINIAGKIKWGLYSESGQKVFEVTTDTVQPVAMFTTNLDSPKLISPGLYYIAVLALENANISLQAYNFSDISPAYLNRPGKAVLVGELTVPTNTLPNLIDPTTIVFVDGRNMKIILN